MAPALRSAKTFQRKIAFSYSGESGVTMWRCGSKDWTSAICDVEMGAMLRSTSLMTDLILTGLLLVSFYTPRHMCKNAIVECRTG